MSQPSDDRVKLVTSQLKEERLLEYARAKTDMVYTPVPYEPNDSQAGPAWRVRFDLVHDPQRRLGIEINGEVFLGRGSDAQGLISLDKFDADQLGVSRRHLLLRPTESKLYILDMGSTNGTQCNGRSIGVNTPYSLGNGSLLTLGKLELVVRIIKRPVSGTMTSRTNNTSELELDELLMPMARAITSQLNFEEVLKQALDHTRSVASVDEASIWLVDEQSGELFLEAEWGIESDQLRRMRLSVDDSLAGQVIATGKPVRAQRTKGQQIKLQTGYLVDAVIYVPLNLGGVTFGVLSAAYRYNGNIFTDQDEKAMMMIAELTAIAIQNTRLYEATERALARRSKVVTALNYILSSDVKKRLNATLGYVGMLQTIGNLDEETGDLAAQVFGSANELIQLNDRLVEITTLCEKSQLRWEPCDLVDVIQRAIDNLDGQAAEQQIKIEFNRKGLSRKIQGDTHYLYRSVLHLLNNALKFSPPKSHIEVTLHFAYNEIGLSVVDHGPGIPAEDLPHIFNRYYRTQENQSGHDGLGLGLEVVREVAVAHRGKVAARNVPGGGAEFTITLPISLVIE